MGQRLNIEIKKDSKVLANAYYHWSAYTSSALQMLPKSIDSSPPRMPELNWPGYTSLFFDSWSDKVLEQRDTFFTSIGCECKIREEGADMVMTVLPYERMLVRAYASASVSIYSVDDYFWRRWGLCEPLMHSVNVNIRLPSTLPSALLSAFVSTCIPL